MEHKKTLKTRMDKIKFLSGLITGERNLNELNPGKVLYFFKNDNFGNDLYKGDDRYWTKQEIEYHILKNPNDQITIINFIHESGGDF